MGVKERFNSKNTSDASKDGVQKRYEARQLYNETINRVNDLLTDFNSIKIPDVSKYGDYSSEIGSYGQIAFRSDKLKNELKQLKNNGYLEQYSQLSKILEDIKHGADTNRYHLQDINDFYSSFEDENQYKTWIKEGEKEKIALKEDVNSLKIELVNLNNVLNQAKNIQGNIDIYTNRGNAFKKRSGGLSTDGGNYSKANQYQKELDDILRINGYSNLAQLEKDIAEKEKYYNYVNSLQEKTRLLNATNPDSEFFDTDCEKYIALGKEYYESKHTNNPKYTDLPVVNYDQKGYVSSNIEKNDNYSEKLFSFNYENMKAEEKNIYHYWLGKAVEEANGGQINDELAKKYEGYIQEAINYRRGLQVAKDAEGKIFEQYIVTAGSSLERYFNNINTAVNSETEHIPNSVLTFASQKVRDDLESETFPFWYNIKEGKWMDKAFGSSLGQIGNDIVGAAAYMAPSMAVAYVPVIGKYLSLASIGLSSYGGAYQEKINEGYSKEQAKTYATLVGISEAALQYFLGGISKIGGKHSTSNAITNLVDKIDNVFLRGVVQLELSSNAEGLEEGLQRFLEPVFESLATGETFESAKWNDILYDAFVGKMMGYAFEGSNVAIDIKNQKAVEKVGKNIVESNSIDSVLNAAEYLGKLDPEIAGQVKALNNFKEKATKGKSNSAYNRTLGKVAVTVAENAIDVKQNIVESAVSKELKSRKVGADVVNKVSKIVSKYIAGEKLSSSEQGYLKHNNVAATIVQEIKAAQEQIKAESVTSIDAQNSSNVPSAPQWAVDMLKAIGAVDSAVGIINYAATGKTKEDEHQAEVNRMIKLLSIASGKTTAEQEAEAGDIPYSQYIKEKESAAQKENTAEDSGEMEVSTNGIYAGMSEEERYGILKDQSARLTEVEVLEESIDYQYLEKAIKSKAEKHLIQKIKSLGFLKKYSSKAIKPDFDFTVKGLRKSLYSQISYGGNYSDFAKAITNLPKLLDNAVLIETHTDKAVGTDRENARLKQVYVMVSVLKDGNNIIPVQFEVKQYVDNENRLYLAVALTKIETGVMGNTASDNQIRTSLVPISTISLHNLFQNINPQDANFLKYVPDGFLNEEQKLAKNKALQEERVKYGREQSTAGEDFNGFSEVDVSEDDVTYESRLLHTMRGAKITTEGQAYIKRICKNLGIDVVFENVLTPKGKHADGYIDDNGVIHIDYHCSNSVEFVLKHELTHFGETSPLYKSFCNAVLSSDIFGEWISSKVEDGDTVTLKTALMREQIAELYKINGVELSPAKQQNEMIANFVGEVLFSSNTNGLERLTTNMTVKEKKSVIDYIKSFIAYIKEKLSKVKGVSSEILSLERKFNELISTAHKSKIADEGGGFSISEDGDGYYVKIDTSQEIFDGKSIQEQQDIAKKIIKDNFKGKVLVVGTKGSAYVNKNSAEEYAYPANRRMDISIKESKMRAAPELDNLLAVSEFVGNISDDGRHPEATGGWDTYLTRFKIGNDMFKGEVKIKVTDRGYVFYDITKIEKLPVNGGQTVTKTAAASGSLSTDIIDDNLSSVNSNSMQESRDYSQEDISENEENTVKGSFSIPTATSGEVDSDVEAREVAQLTEFPDLMAVLTDRRKRGEISEEDYMLEVRDLLDRASEKYGVIEHGENLEAVNRAYAESVDDTVIDFVEDARQETNKRRLEWMHHKFNNDIPITIQKKIANLVGFDISEFSILLNGEAIHHIDKRHGRKGKHDNSMQNDNDIARMQYIISNADNAEYTVDVSGKQVYDSQYRNSDNTKSYLVTLSKKINGYYYVILAVPDSNSKTMHIKSAYISKKIKKEDSQEFDAKAPNTTSKTNLDISSKYSIPKDTPNVNNQYFIDIEAREAAQLTEFPDLMAVLTDRRKRGEISEEDYMLEVRDLLDRASEKYGVIEQGELAENKMQLPKRVTSDKSEKTKRWVRTVHESGILPEDMEVELEAEILKEAMSYKVINNAEAQRQANTAIQRGTALKEWEAAVNSDGLVGKREIAIGETLLKLAAERKDSKTVMKLIAEVSEMGTRAGQVVQAMSMLKRMDGIGQLYYVQKCVEKINRGLDKRFARKVKKGKISGIPQVKINETLANQLANSKTKEDFEVTYEAMMQSIAEQVPTTFLDKWNAWRYFAMLFNPRTHIRNILGNFGFIPAVRTKDILASAIERIFLDKSEYTKSAIVKKEYREFALNDFAEAESIITGSGKMNPSDEIRDKQAVFDTKWLEKLRKWNFDALEKEDAIFLKKHYSHALGGFLQARNIDITKDIESSVMEGARKYAIVEAQKATYRDASSIVNVLQRTTHTKSQVWNSIVEGVLPFKKTPINIVRRGIEYSPIGLIKTLTKGNYDLVNGDITASQFIDGIAGGLTGTGIVLLGILLSSLGFINVTGGFGDDEEDDINRLLGRQEYAVEIAGHSYTIDWMAPACIPLFIGVEIQKALEEKGNANFIQSIKNVAGSALEPIINLSMLSGMQDILSSAKYSDGAAVVSSVLWNIALSYGSQALPSLTGAVARTIDGKRRTTYIDRNSWLSDMGQMALNKVGSKIPFASKLRSEYVDEFGRTEESGNVFTRAIQNFFSPGYYSKIEEDPVIEELRTLYEQTGETVLPTKPKKYINVNGDKKHLTAEEYEEYAIEVGQERYDYLKELFGNSQARTLSYEEKRKVISDLYSYSLAKGKTHYSEYKLPDLYEKAYEAEKNGISPVDYYLSKIATNVENADTDGSGTVTKNERLAAIYKMDVSNDIKAALIALYS